MQIVEIRETVEELVIQRYVEEAVRKPRLFEGEADDALLSWGVPEDWLDVVRDATEDTVLDIAGHLPAEAGEALLQAATGGRPQPAAQVEGADPFALEERLLSANDEARLDEIMNTERHLLYVAASRARDHLWMSGVAPVSEFLADVFQLKAHILAQ
ncbi:putative DNA helicase [Roseobacter sp. AzwK-3b]|uniref:hypothetical protein n=1 Tax=Roseobacter sp. AzwK-3b TaxID=351016 RepID=UPI000156983B|nr:hypothetical protein [Roseobacter sp. AzwK-3b]EDM72167.1 putative DNA helicase [Roseobacter sp. AzwK-3b]